MELNGKAKLLKIFCGESDRVDGGVLFEKIIFAAHHEGIAGATAHRGIMSFGASHSIHTMKIFALSGDLPIIIEIIDTEDKINAFLPTANNLLSKSGKGGLILIEDAVVINYIKGEKYRIENK